MMQELQAEISNITFEVELQVLGQILVTDITSEYMCEEIINAGQVVTFGSNGVRLCKANDNSINSVIGIAITSGQIGDKIKVKLQGVIASYDKRKGILYCDNNGWLSNSMGDNIIVVGYQFLDNLALIFPEKNIIFVE